MVVYLILYGAGMLFASSAHYYMSGMSLILAALYLYFYDYRRAGTRSISGPCFPCSG